MYSKPEPGQEPRHNGTLDEIWNLMDQTPEGRPNDFEPQPQYGMSTAAA
jgi:predicted dithiol-disulfide oxidoreductase (DUF899 family)